MSEGALAEAVAIELIGGAELRGNAEKDRACGLGTAEMDRVCDIGALVEGAWTIRPNPTERIG